MAKFLIVYGSKQGQTKKIAEYIAAELTAQHARVDIFDVEQIPDEISPSAYDATIIGGAVHMHGFPVKLKMWVREYAHELKEKKSMFYSVCLGILQEEKTVQDDEQAILDSFFTDTGWKPDMQTIFAGALTYSKYNWFVKLLMRSLAKKAGSDTDPTRDYEYTNWHAVRQFAQSSLLKTKQGEKYVR